MAVILKCGCFKVIILDRYLLNAVLLLKADYFLFNNASDGKCITTVILHFPSPGAAASFSLEGIGYNDDESLRYKGLVEDIPIVTASFQGNFGRTTQFLQGGNQCVYATAGVCGLERLPNYFTGVIKHAATLVMCSLYPNLLIRSCSLSQDNSLINKAKPHEAIRCPLLLREITLTQLLSF